MTLPVYGVVLLAMLSSLLLTPVVRSLATSCGIVDSPDGRRKLHTHPIPLGGGVAVLVAVFFSLCVSIWLSPSVSSLLSGHERFLTGLAISAFSIVVVGLIDDRIQLRGRQKLLGQILAATVLMLAGLVVREIQMFGWHIELGLLSVPFTMFWILGAINALNLIDGIDGLAGSVGVILSVTIAGMAWLSGHHADAILALALAGGIFGFLLYNLPPATIFLGDCGSMLIGLMLGALAIRSSLKGAATVALAAPTVVWAIPIFDVGMAILRRKLTGRSIYETDRSHLHHCLLRRGLSGRGTLLWISGFCACTSIGALASVAQQNEWLAILSALSVIGILVVTRVFGHGEFFLLARRVRTLVLSLLHVGLSGKNGHRDPIHARLTGTRDWNDLWQTLTEYAERFDLSWIQLNVNLPAVSEVYHVSWERKNEKSTQPQWSTEIPLMMSTSTIGRLSIRGHCPSDQVCTWMGELIGGLKPFETQLVSLVLEENIATRRPQPMLVPSYSTGHSEIQPNNAGT